jgi:hypothetical protein
VKNGIGGRGNGNAGCGGVKKGMGGSHGRGVQNGMGGHGQCGQ